MASPETAPRAAPAAASGTPVMDVLDVLDTLGEGAILLDGAKLLAANESYLALTGFTFPELAAFPSLFAIIAPEELPRVKERFLARGLDVPRKEEYDTVLVRKDGARVRVEIASTTVPALGPKHVLSIVRDVTRRKEAEDALRQSEDRFRRAFDDAAIGMALYDGQGNFVRVNHALAQMLGYAEDELIRLGWRALTHPDDVQPIEERGARYRQAGTPGALRLEKRYLRKDGAILWGSLTSSPIRDDSGKIVQFVTQVVDVTARHAHEERLAERAAFFESSNDAIVVADASGRVTAWSPGAERLYGYTQEEALGRELVFLAPPGLEHEVDDLREGRIGPTIETRRCLSLRSLSCATSIPGGGTRTSWMRTRFFFAAAANCASVPRT